jgi:hypothetical protein
MGDACRTKKIYRGKLSKRRHRLAVVEWRPKVKNMLVKKFWGELRDKTQFMEVYGIARKCLIHMNTTVKGYLSY